MPPLKSPYMESFCTKFPTKLPALVASALPRGPAAISRPLTAKRAAPVGALLGRQYHHLRAHIYAFAKIASVEQATLDVNIVATIVSLPQNTPGSSADPAPGDSGSDNNQEQAVRVKHESKKNAAPPKGLVLTRKVPNVRQPPARGPAPWRSAPAARGGMSHYVSGRCWLALFGAFSHGAPRDSRQLRAWCLKVPEASYISTAGVLSDRHGLLSCTVLAEVHD